MPTAIAQNENDEMVANAVKAYIATDSLQLRGCVTNVPSIETITYANLSTYADVDLSSPDPIQAGAVSQVTNGAGGVAFGMPVNNAVLKNFGTASKTVTAVILVNLTKSKVMYLLKLDTPIVIAPDGTTTIHMTLWFDTASYS